ncbi:MAG: diguanylate cyclase (GGDEF)-like protein [Oleiphilaceae bacterium]|jgi:diguanylate cyclase (GGDEF)-like protein
MTQENQREKLKQLFAKRVTTQARVVLDIYQKCRSSSWSEPSRRLSLTDAAEKLDRFAERFEMPQQQQTANKIIIILKSLAPGQLLGEEQQEELDKVIQELNDCTLRKTDSKANKVTQIESSPRTLLRTPIYLALNNTEYANRIIDQLEFFGFRSMSFNNSQDLILAAKQDKPETIVADIDFDGSNFSGIESIREIQNCYDVTIPIIFVSDRRDDIEARLMASRTGGEEFFYRAVDPGQLIEKIENYTHASTQDPYRILVVDDSKAQAKYIENILNKSGMIPGVITDPMQILVALNDFQPEIIIMDMYMPGCTGMELARVIRQQDKFHSVPIIYLSAEDDVNKQLHAMSLGGDDFLTKPIDPKHLVATLINRGRRARSLLALMIRDSLTGLFNHTHTLYLLDLEINKAQQKSLPLSFAMLDIDYFKKVNDNYGHPIGDRVLKSLSLFLKQRLRKTDHIGRYGGEEFAIVLPNTTERDAKIILNEIRERFSELPQPAGDKTFNVTFSCGIAMSSIENSQSLCEKADQALYDAKRNGRNTVRCYNMDM